MVLRVAVSGIPRGYQFSRSDGNWMTDEHKKKIKAISPDIELVEIPADEVKDNPGYEVGLAEGGNPVHSHGGIAGEGPQQLYNRDPQWGQPR